MSWYNEATFYHIYPLGLTGAPKENDYGTPVHLSLIHIYDRNAGSEIRQYG